MRNSQCRRCTFPVSGGINRILRLGFGLCLAVLPCRAAFADATTEAELRAALQQSTAQIATLEDQVANLRAQQAPDAVLIKSLQAQVQKLSQNTAPTETAADKAKNDAAIAALKQQLAAQAAELGKTRSAYSQAASTANADAAQNTQLSSQVTALKTQMNGCEVKNAALFRLGNQILDAYSHKDDVFSGFTNHEPFIGFARVKLQNIVQSDYDKLLDNQIDQGQGSP